MRQIHVAGEKTVVDYSGHTLEVAMGTPARRARRRSSSPCSVLRTTPTPKPALSQSLPDLIGSHVRAFCFFGGAAQQTVSGKETFQLPTFDVGFERCSAGEILNRQNLL
ncbi:hypothetical protein H8A97_44260 [Bradyrhizobium sp. Arg62]|nr:hypothetical protein [Bradyrhizobium ivorense]MCC8951847.1 hypothetical protein [Bradyrhizobium brasilense]